MKYRIIIIVIMLFSLMPAKAGFKLAGSNHANFLPVLKENYVYYAILNQPDSVNLILQSNISRSPDTNVKAWKSYIIDNEDNDRIARNKKMVSHLVKNNTALFFRCYFKNAGGQVYRYQDISLTGHLVKEMIGTDLGNNFFEEKKFSKNGMVYARSQFHYSDTEIIQKPVYLRDSTGHSTHAGDRNDTIKKAYWYASDHATDPGKITKSGKQTIFYPSGAVRFEMHYSAAGTIDSTTEYFESGKAKPRETYQNHRTRVLLVGIEEYITDTSSLRAKYKIRNLDGCVNDVNGMESVFKNKKIATADNITKLTNSTATKKGIFNTFYRLADETKKGDVIFIHFSASSGSFYDSATNRSTYGISCSNYNYEYSGAAGIINDTELESLLKLLRKKIGNSGQLIISLDICHAGGMFDTKKDENNTDTVTGKISLRGESSNILLNLTSGTTSPIAIFTATNGNELAYEAHDENGNTYGAYSMAFIRTLSKYGMVSTDEFYDQLKAELNHITPRPVHPGLYESFPQVMFHRNDAEENTVAETVLPELKIKSKCFTLNVGISNYNTKGNSSRHFNNCANDAIVYEQYLRTAYTSIAADPKLLTSRLLTNSGATKDSIISSINYVISNSGPDDYFIFNFSGYCRKLTDSTGRHITYFVPYGLKNIDDTNEIKRSSISLTQLKDLLQFIPANNQLFITEAGNTNDFQKEFIQALVESSPSIAAMSNKNRVFIVPKGTGIDKFSCRALAVDHGPLNYYITTLPDDLNIFGLFDSSIYYDAIKYALNKKEVDCDNFRSGYFDIFSEQRFMKEMTSYLPSDVLHTRGLQIMEQERDMISDHVSHRYALVIGNNKYDGKPNWNDLKNPVSDANAISYELGAGFDYTVYKLIDATADSLYWYISFLANKLQPNDQLLIYAAGHGYFDAGLFDDGFIVCKDSKPLATDPYRNSYIQFSRLSRMINKLPSRQILIMLDVCFGGTFDARIALNTNRGDNDELSNVALLEEKLKKQTRLYITSGSKNVVPDGYNATHSPFAQKIIQTLQTRGGAGKILTAYDLYQSIQKLPSKPLLGSFGDDEAGSNYIFLAKEKVNSN